MNNPILMYGGISVLVVITVVLVILAIKKKTTSVTPTTPSAATAEQTVEPVEPIVEQTDDPVEPIVEQTVEPVEEKPVEYTPSPSPILPQVPIQTELPETEEEPESDDPQFYKKYSPVEVEDMTAELYEVDTVTTNKCGPNEVAVRLKGVSGCKDNDIRDGNCIEIEGTIQVDDRVAANEFP